MIELVETHRLVSIADVDYVNGLADQFRRSGDPEERNIGLIAAAILERLGLKENAPEAATSKGQHKKIHTFIVNEKKEKINGNYQ